MGEQEFCTFCRHKVMFLSPFRRGVHIASVCHTALAGSIMASFTRKSYPIASGGLQDI